MKAQKDVQGLVLASAVGHKLSLRRADSETGESASGDIVIKPTKIKTVHEDERRRQLLGKFGLMKRKPKKSSGNVEAVPFIGTAADSSMISVSSSNAASANASARPSLASLSGVRETTSPSRHSRQASGDSARFSNLSASVPAQDMPNSPRRDSDMSPNRTFGSEILSQSLGANSPPPSQRARTGLLNVKSGHARQASNGSATAISISSDQESLPSPMHFSAPAGAARRAPQSPSLSSQQQQVVGAAPTSQLHAGQDSRGTSVPATPRGAVHHQRNPSAGQSSVFMTPASSLARSSSLHGRPPPPSGPAPKPPNFTSAVDVDDDDEEMDDEDQFQEMGANRRMSEHTAMPPSVLPATVVRPQPQPSKGPSAGPSAVPPATPTLTGNSGGASHNAGMVYAAGGSVPLATASVSSTPSQAAGAAGNTLNTSIASSAQTASTNASPSKAKVIYDTIV